MKKVKIINKDSEYFDRVYTAKFIETTAFAPAQYILIGNVGYVNGMAFETNEVEEISLT